MPLVLRWSPSSPYSCKVLVAARELGLFERIQLLATNVRAPDASFLADAPLGKIPVLILEDGTRLFDSRVICEYLDSVHGGCKLFPAVGKDRWRALRQQALADGVLDAGLLLRYEGRRPESERSPKWIEKQTSKLTRAVAHLAQAREELSDEPTIGTIAIAVALSYLDFRFPDVAWREQSQRLLTWYSEMSRRPSLVESALHEGH